MFLNIESRLITNDEELSEIVEKEKYIAIIKIPKLIHVFDAKVLLPPTSFQTLQQFHYQMTINKILVKKTDGPFYAIGYQIDEKAKNILIENYFKSVYPDIMLYDFIQNLFTEE